MGKVKEVSGKTLKSSNFDRAYIINDRNRKRYGISSPFKTEKNLFYYHEETNKIRIRKLELSNLPTDVKIYWKDSESPDGTGCPLLMELFSDSEE